MHIITKKRIKNFYAKHKDAKKPLLAWHGIIKKTRYANFAELRNTFPSADLVGRCTVFNIGGNKYRLITVIHYNTGKIFIRDALTHQDYDKKSWEKECGHD